MISFLRPTTRWPVAEKGKSPFYPGQPVPKELFVGRAAQIERIITRGLGQSSLGKPVAMFVQGEYGIGKSSIASYVGSVGEASHGAHVIHAMLGGAKDLNDVGRAILQATVESGAFEHTRTEKVRNWLAKYIGKQELFGVSLDLSALKADAPALATALGTLGFMREAIKRLEAKCIVLILDELNGITSNAQFSHFIKGLVDENAISPNPVPLLLLLCGTEERRREMIRQHQPTDRIFDIVEIDLMSDNEMHEFFTKAFESAAFTVEDRALHSLCRYSAGFPKIMHVIGDATFWFDKDGVITWEDAMSGIVRAADDIGKKFVDQQIVSELRSADYRSILDKVAVIRPTDKTFRKSELDPKLTESEKRNFGNFIQKMKKLNVLKSGVEHGEYEFTMIMGAS